MRENMQAPAPSPAPEQSAPQAGNATQLLVSINEGLTQLGDLIDKSGLSDQDKASYANLMQNFMAFADNLGQPTGAGPAKKGSTGNVPVETMGRPTRPMM